jgi:deoxyribose-phosphate aldolase
LVNESGAEFIKTSTGFQNIGATVEAIEAMKTYGRPGLKIKASGGIRTLADAKKFIDLGADRIGASASVAMMEELRKSK